MCNISFDEKWFYKMYHSIQFVLTFKIPLHTVILNPFTKNIYDTDEPFLKSDNRLWLSKPPPYRG